VSNQTDTTFADGIQSLAAVTAIEEAAHPAPVLPEQPDQLPPADCGTIALTVPEAQRQFHLLTTLTCSLPPHAARALITRHLNWSDGRISLETPGRAAGARHATRPWPRAGPA
jgi:hypothetical protein